MRIETRLFGTVEIGEEKIITFPRGIIGFSYMKQFTLIRDEDNPDSSIMWLQSVEEPQFALPVVEPNLIIEGYDPMVNDEYLEPLGELKPGEIYSLVTITVPGDITKMTANLKAPVVINMENNRAVQLIVEDDFLVKHPIYDILAEKKEGK